jgi:hypothetical protein
MRSIPTHSADKLVLALALCLSAPAAGNQTTATRWTPSTISTDQYESSPAFTPDGKEMYFMSADKRYQNYRILWSRCENGAWSKPVPPSFAAAPPVLEADPFVTADGKRLYFVSSRQSKTQDDLDIWYVERKADGAWGDAQRLPEPVNSKSSELLPRADAQGRVYFGSSREGGLGQSDIYVASQAKDGKWQVSILGAPISSKANEYEAEISRDGNTMVVVADRGDRSHLYLYRKRDGKWVEEKRVPAFDKVFQVGPLLSPKADRLLFAQADGERSGEFFLIDLVPDPDKRWPPSCGAGAAKP